MIDEEIITNKIDISCEKFPDAFILCGKEWNNKLCFWMFSSNGNFRFPWTRKKSTRPQMEGGGLDSLEEARLCAIRLLNKRINDWEQFCETELGKKYVSGLISEDELFAINLKELRDEK